MIRVPLATKMKPNDFFVFEIAPRIEVRGSQGEFFGLPFLVDTCTDYTMISLDVANELGIPYTTDRETTLVTSIGSGDRPGYLSPLWFSFKDLPEWQFETVACFSPYRHYSLLSITDVLRHFSVGLSLRSNTPKEPYGAALLSLRPDHGGRPRH